MADLVWKQIGIMFRYTGLGEHAATDRLHALWLFNANTGNGVWKTVLLWQHHKCYLLLASISLNLFLAISY